MKWYAHPKVCALPVMAANLSKTNKSDLKMTTKKCLTTIWIQTLELSAIMTHIIRSVDVPLDLDTTTNIDQKNKKTLLLPWFWLLFIDFSFSTQKFFPFATVKSKRTNSRRWKTITWNWSRSFAVWIVAVNCIRSVCYTWSRFGPMVSYVIIV